MKKLNYYEVTAKCGHVGKNNYILITFPVRAQSKKEAAERTRNFPRVKHHQKDAIKSVKEITADEYQFLLENYRSDLYNFSKSKQEQNILCGEELSKRILNEQKEINYTRDREGNINKKLALYKIKSKESRSYINKYCYD